MRKAEKLLAILLAALLALSALPAGADALISAAITREYTEGDFTYTVSGSSAVVTGYTGGDEVVSVPSTLGGYPVRRVAENAFGYDCTAKKIVFGEGIKRFDARCLLSCPDLAEIVLPSTAEGIPFDYENIMWGMAGDSFVKSCHALLRITVSDDNPEIMSVDGVLYSRDGTQLIKYPAGRTDRVYCIEDGTVYINEQAFENNDYIEEAILPDTVHTVNYWAFNGCTRLKKINIPEGCCRIGQYALQNTAIEELHLPASLRTIVMGFPGMHSLRSITVDPDNPNYFSEDGILYADWSDTDGGTALICYPSEKEGDSFTPDDDVISYSWYAFTHSKHLKRVILPEGTKSIAKSMFYGSEKLSYVYIPDSVETIEHSAFFDCSSLTSVTLPAGLTTVGDYIFANVQLADVYFKGTEEQWNEVSVDGNNENLFGAVFHYAIEDTSVFWGFDGGRLIIDGSGEIPDVTRAGAPWEGFASGVNEIVIADGVTRVGSGAFSGCTECTSLRISASVTSIGSGAFSDCAKLSDVCYGGTAEDWADISIGDDNAPLDAAEFHYGEAGLASGALSDGIRWELGFDGTLTVNGAGDMPDLAYDQPAPWEDHKGRIKRVVIGDGVGRIGEYSFQGSPALTEAVIAGSVVSIGRSAFASCSVLSGVVLSEGVETIGSYAFSNCDFIAEIDIPASVTSIASDAFYSCSGLSAIRVAEGNRSYRSEGGVLYSFDMSTILLFPAGIAGSFTVPDSVTSVGDNCFAYCYGLENVDLNSVTSIGSSCFLNCGIRSVTIPYGVSRIPGNAFSGCMSLTEVVFPESLEEIRYYAFNGCESLTEIVLPESLKTVGWGAFAWCRKLKSVTLPAGLESIDDLAFSYCFSLESVYYHGTENMRSLIAIGSDNDRLLDAEWHYNTVSGISMQTLPDVLEYKIGDEFDPTGGEVLVSLGGGIELVLPLTADMVSGFDSSASGALTLTVTFEGFTASFDVVIIDPLIPGDADGNGAVEPSDALLILRYSMGIIDGEGLNLDNCDYDGSGKVDAVDALLALRKAMGII
ncbi:MAG: leucine-rich repeat protein [Clostridiales bacterium]|nr:leucine-rich repeat protein [Clostridiales bacterium]